MLNISRMALRYYMRKGLISGTKDEENGYHYFDENDLQDLKDIVHLRQTLDFSVEEIRDYLYSDSLDDYRSLVRQRMESLQKEIEEKQAQLRSLNNWWGLLDELDTYASFEVVNYDLTYLMLKFPLSSEDDYWRYYYDNRIGREVVAPFRIYEMRDDAFVLSALGFYCAVDSDTMLRADSPACAILLGLNEGEFPQAIADSGFFTDSDKRALESLGLELSPSGERRAAQELFFVYRAVTAPRSHLLCFCHRADTAGKSTLPSLAMNRLCLLCGRRQPEIWEDLPMLDRLWAREPAFLYTALLGDAPEGAALRQIFSADPDYAERAAALDMPITERNCTLSRETADALFGERMQLSQSRVDCYVSCPFAYFCRYLLNLRDEQPAQIGYDSVGTYVHAVLERFFGELTVDGVLHLPDTEAELSTRLDAVVSAYLRDLFSGIPATARITHLFDRLRRLSRLLIDNLITEFRQSQFVPVLFELPIRRSQPGSPEPLVFALPDGTPVWLGGIIDRVDIWRAENGRIYLRVVDYKTGSKPFDRADIDIGYNLQLLLYLFTLCRSQSHTLRTRLGLAPDTPLVPAGMLYCTALAPDMAMPADASSEEILAQADAKLTRRGIVLDEEPVLRAMDSTLSGKYIPCQMRKTGLSSPESRANAEEFEQLYAQLDRTLRRVAGEMRTGKAHARPRRRGGSYPCENCPAQPVCRAGKK